MLAPDIMDQFPDTYKSYIGGIDHGVLQGEGKMIWSDNVRYKGEFLDGSRHGQGTIKDADGKVVLTGNWAKDFPDGRVLAMALPDGKIYSGGFQQGQRQGVGELFHNGVSIYEGLWMNDLPNGRGALYSDDGSYEGELKDGKRHGKGRFDFKTEPQTYGLGRIYEGDWKNDQPDGNGRYTNELGLVHTYQ